MPPVLPPVLPSVLPPPLPPLLLILPPGGGAALPARVAGVVLEAPGAWTRDGLARVRAQAAGRGLGLWVRLGCEEDPAAALALGPDGLVLAGAEDGPDVVRLGARLAVHEAEAGLPDGRVRILPLVLRARGILRVDRFVEASPRLAGLAWDPAALAQDLGLAEGADPLPAPCVQARAAVVLAAAAAGVPAYEAGPGDPASALRDGIRGFLVRDDAQVGRLAAAVAGTTP